MGNAMRAEIVFKNNYLRITDFIYHKEDEYYNCSFDLQVKSGCFSGVAPCEYNMKDFVVFVDDITDVYNFKKQTAVLNDIGYGSSVTLEADKTGHIEISGEIYGYSMDHSLKFSFSADQTVLESFISELKQIIC